ncbi:MAG: HAMP domain-containing histidine kinase [Anaerolineales bacterium]|nr:MAG: HAMP domain-containing histidine kinase [Anaerolineales bacterium]
MAKKRTTSTSLERGQKRKAEPREKQAKSAGGRDVLAVTLGDLERAHKRVAALEALVQLKDEEIEGLKQSLSDGGARRAGLVRELELRMKDLRELNEQLAARNRDLDAFGYTVAHDLRAPLANAISYARLLVENRDSLPEEAQGECLEAIAETGQKMINIVNELLLLAGLRHTEVYMRPVGMAEVVQESLGRLSFMVDECEADIVLPDSWDTVAGHGPWIEEIWVNYVSNALKYGGCPPRVELGTTAEEDGTVRCWVRDNGDGLTAEQQGSLFTPFTRLGQVSVAGYGLGLSIVLRIVEKMGGRVGVESDVGNGSVFSFYLPAATEGQAQRAGPVRPA